jgi:hypothetical protein
VARAATPDGPESIKAAPRRAEASGERWSGNRHRERADPFVDVPGRSSVLRRSAGVAVAVTALLVVAGCATSEKDTSIGTDGIDREHAVAPADDSVSADGMRTVIYRGVQFEVPAAWAVHDLEADPTTCVRFDVNAVYLGHPGGDMACPAGLVGRADTVLVEPADGTRGGRTGSASEGGAVATAMATASGLEVQLTTDAGVAEVEATLPSAGVDVTFTYRDSDATVQQILSSFRAAS